MLFRSGPGLVGRRGIVSGMAEISFISVGVSRGYELQAGGRGAEWESLRSRLDLERCRDQETWRCGMCCMWSGR